MTIRERMTNRVAAALAVVVMLASAASARAFQAPAGLPADEEKRFSDAWALQPIIELGVPAGPAKVVIVKFNDWLCGGCKAMHEIYEPLLARYEKEMPGAVKLVMKDWPWNTKCNIATAQTFRGHEASCDAAVAVRLAREKGKDAEMIAWLFAEQDRLIDLGMKGNGATTAIKTKAAALLGITTADFDRQSAAKLIEVRQDVSDGITVRVDSTPTYFVNGVRTTAPSTPSGGGGNLPVDYLDLAIRLELKKKAGK